MSSFKGGRRSIVTVGGVKAEIPQFFDDVTDERCLCFVTFNFFLIFLPFSVFFSVASYLTSLALIEDRLGGVWNRFAVAGVKPYQFLISHLISGSCLMFLQALEFIIFAIYLSFEYSFNFIMLISLLLILMGLCGVIYGLMISVLTDSTLVSSFASLLALYPFLCLSG